MDERDLIALKNKYDIIGNDPALNRALRVAVTVAPADDLTVLISGESGVGKDVLPRIIHQNSPRKSGRYFAVNCGAIAEGTMDSELFGHEKGAFTSAIETRKGYFEEADGGTLFLDEIGELPLASQAKLLRVLQSGEFIRVGSSKVLKTNVRIIAATNRNLMHLVSQGKFRADLYYRINTIQIEMPALRERKEDIHLLFRKFVSDFSNKYSRTNIRLTDDAVSLLKSYRWPGNIRQLKSVAESVAMLESIKMTPGHEKVDVDAVTLARYIPREEGNTLPVLAQEQDSMGSDKEMIIRMILSLKQEVDSLKELVYGGPASSGAQRMIASSAKPSDRSAGAVDIYSGQPEVDEQTGMDDDPKPAEEKKEDLSLEDNRDEKIRQALRTYPTKKMAAQALGVSERTLYRWLDTHKL